MILDDTRAKINSQLIVTLAKQALDNLKTPKIVSMKRNIPHHMFRQEFGTVKISLPRQSGHSTAALQLLVEHPDSLLFVARQHQRDDLRQRIRELTPNLELRARVDDSVIALSEHAMKNIRPLESRPFVIFDQGVLFERNILTECIDTFGSAQIVVQLH